MCGKTPMQTRINASAEHYRAQPNVDRDSHPPPPGYSALHPPPYCLFSTLVAASTGQIFVVRCQDFKLERVVEAHSTAVTAIVTSAKQCVTAEASGLIRVWPLDLSVRAAKSTHRAADIDCWFLIFLSLLDFFFFLPGSSPTLTCYFSSGTRLSSSMMRLSCRWRCRLLAVSSFAALRLAPLAGWIWKSKCMAPCSAAMRPGLPPPLQQTTASI